MRDQAGGSPMYSVAFGGRLVVLPSRLGVDLAEAGGLGRKVTIEGVQRRVVNEVYTQHPGKRSRVVDHCEEVTVSLHDRSPQARRWEVVLRAYDDGVAFRYRFPAQEGWDRLVIAAERTGSACPTGPSHTRSR